MAQQTEAALQRKNTSLLLWALLTILLIFGVLGGATATGLLTPQYRTITLLLLTLIMLGWLITRRMNRWKCYYSPLTTAFVCWAAAIAISAVANMDAFRRIEIGIWFALLYLGIWYFLEDSIINNGLPRQALVDCLIFAGCIVLFSGYQQLANYWIEWQKNAGQGALIPFSIPRITSMLVNSNVLAAYLVMLIPLFVSRVFSIRNLIGRTLFVVGAVLSLMLLFFTDSRGGLVGAALGLVSFVMLVLLSRNLLSPVQLSILWQAQSTLRRALAVGLILLVMSGSAVVALRLIRSLSEGGRTLELRTYIFDAAFTMFREKPITGYGLFAYGREQLRLASTPPLTSHTNAHNLVLNVAAEMGILGLLALVVTFILIIRAIYRNWQTATFKERLLLSGTIASAVSLTTHHMIDLPAVGTPLIFIAGMIVVAVSITPFNTLAVQVKRPQVHLALSCLVCFMVLAVGWWNNTLYADYVNILSQTTQANYAESAQRLDVLRQRDPRMPIYDLYRGYFLSLLAQNGNPEAAQQAIKAYQRFCLTWNPIMRQPGQILPLYIGSLINPKMLSR
jgi:O-antigen ligase